MLSGAIRPDAGEILVDGEPRRFRGPNDARALGIETLYQDLALLPNLDVATNLYLGRERMRPAASRRPLGLLARRRMRRDARGAPGRAAHPDPAPLGHAGRVALGRSAAERRDRARAWSGPPARDHGRADGGPRRRAVAGGARARQARARARHVRVVIICHILPHVLELADRVVVLRHGEKVADLPASGSDAGPADRADRRLRAPASVVSAGPRARAGAAAVRRAAAGAAPAVLGFVRSQEPAAPASACRSRSTRWCWSRRRTRVVLAGVDTIGIPAPEVDVLRGRLAAAAGADPPASC